MQQVLLGTMEMRLTVKMMKSKLMKKEANKSSKLNNPPLQPMPPLTVACDIDEQEIKIEKEIKIDNPAADNPSIDVHESGSNDGIDSDDAQSAHVVSKTPNILTPIVEHIKHGLQTMLKSTEENANETNEKNGKNDELVFAENEVPNVSSGERMDALLTALNSDEINMECAMNEAFAYSTNDPTANEYLHAVNKRFDYNNCDHGPLDQYQKHNRWDSQYQPLLYLNNVTNGKPIVHGSPVTILTCDYKFDIYNLYYVGQFTPCDSDKIYTQGGLVYCHQPNGTIEVLTPGMGYSPFQLQSPMGYTATNSVVHFFDETTFNARTRPLISNPSTSTGFKPLYDKNGDALPDW